MIKKLNLKKKNNIKKCFDEYSSIEFNSIEDFEKFVNEFIYYNCNKYVGEYPAYYIED